MKKLSVTLFSLLLGVGVSVKAQTPTAGEMLQLSQHSYSLSSARSAAMGGAFVSLGADLASMSINPAGLGMYRSSEFGFTPSIISSSTQNDYNGAVSNGSKTRFSVGNIGVALNLYQGSRALTSFTLGFAYNKLADFNITTTANQSNMQNSIAEIFAERLNGVDKSLFDGGDYAPFNNLPLYQWGGALAYKVRLLEPVGNNAYTPFGPPVGIGPLSEQSTINPSLRNLSKGSMGEYLISGGMNYTNKLYVGFSIGIQSTYLSNRNEYYETYNNNAYNLENLAYARHQSFYGTGVNFKLGVIGRPTPNLRIGVAVHTPTFYTMEEHYWEEMGTKFRGINYGGMLSSKQAINSFSTSTQANILGGISYTLPGVGLISFDYERSFFNGMRLTNTGHWSVEEDMKREIKEFYQPANNIRVGVELIPVQSLFVRAGYAYYGNCIKDNQLIAENHLDIPSAQNFSGGLGYRFGSGYIDFTYVYSKSTALPRDIFYFKEGDFEIDSGIIRTKLQRHIALVSWGVRF